MDGDLLGLRKRTTLNGNLHLGPCEDKLSLCQWSLLYFFFRNDKNFFQILLKITSREATHFAVIFYCLETILVDGEKQPDLATFAISPSSAEQISCDPARITWGWLLVLFYTIVPNIREFAPGGLNVSLAPPTCPASPGGGEKLALSSTPGGARANWDEDLPPRDH